MEPKNKYYEMFNSDDKKVLEALYDMVMEQSEAIQEIKTKIEALTINKPTPKAGIAGLAEILKCSKSTAAKRLKSGIIPYDRHGDIYLFDENAVREAMRNRKRPRL